MLAAGYVEVSRVLLHGGIAQLRCSYPELVVRERRVSDEFVYTLRQQTK